ncbi:hypothetical protein HHK36_016570 [Tetracentron sinense]|uniref:Phosphatidic acid phosphatase type 2/haloperoxidase domain-containing protein n=1 Tax=Tetracentron sinense TaxID=13715 RepID=A0A834Z1L1_TETSI|nr:hypothetical protein HHK36_016570 [Tetracentron sinense]
MFFFLGLLISQAINEFIKTSVQQARPETCTLLETCDSHGWPSSHSQYMFFFAVYFTLLTYKGIGLSSERQKLIVGFIPWPLALLTMYSRVYLGYHTVAQVFAGATLGIVIGGIWFCVVNNLLICYAPAIEESTIGRWLYIKDSSHIPNVLKFEYDNARAARKNFAANPVACVETNSRILDNVLLAGDGLRAKEAPFGRLLQTSESRFTPQIKMMLFMKRLANLKPLIRKGWPGILPLSGNLLEIGNVGREKAENDAAEVEIVGHHVDEMIAKVDEDGRMESLANASGCPSLQSALTSLLRNCLMATGWEDAAFVACPVGRGFGLKLISLKGYETIQLVEIFLEVPHTFSDHLKDFGDGMHGLSCQFFAEEIQLEAIKIWVLCMGAIWILLLAGSVSRQSVPSGVQYFLLIYLTPLCCFFASEADTISFSILKICWSSALPSAISCTIEEPCEHLLPTLLILTASRPTVENRIGSWLTLMAIEMKLSSKPISSPSRTEKFPPPLMRFLRSNPGSRSRGRSRSSPMFVRKKNAAVETLEPSSPKVTCMGQVRVRRSKQAPVKGNRNGNGSGNPNSTPARRRRRCQCFRKALFCNHFAGKTKPRTSRPVWRRWFMFFQVSHRRKVEIMEDSAKRESKREGTDEESDQEEGEDEEAKVFVSSSPPKNALLLTRCRSAPYRASSLASRFWGSPSGTEDAGEQRTEQENRVHVENQEEEENPTLEKEAICRDSAAQSRTGPEIEVKLGFCEEFESSSNERIAKTSKLDDETSRIGDKSAHPLILTRCKSEPARRSGKFELETCFIEQYQPHVYD